MGIADLEDIINRNVTKNVRKKNPVALVEELMQIWKLRDIKVVISTRTGFMEKKRQPGVERLHF